MFVCTTALQYWKSEHDATSCEDALRVDLAQGLFAIADGAGTTLFSNIWARVLVEHFLQTPLLSNEPFEVEWWVRQAQERYQQEVPVVPSSAWHALQKARTQGSHSTLALLRILNNNEQAIEVEFLVIGDSCLLVDRANSEHLQTFPYTYDLEFEAPPLCLPSLIQLFDRSFHRCLRYQLTFAPGDRAMLATDAVARWVINAGKGFYPESRQAFQTVMEQTPAHWQAFIEGCRERGEMVDDDATALSLFFTSQCETDGQQPGVTNRHSPELRMQRKLAFEHARQEQNTELLSILYGDGVDLALEGIFLSPVEVDSMREVANALRIVIAELRRYLHRPDMLTHMRQVWAHYAVLLEREPCAANLRATLTHNGILPLPSTVPPVAPGTSGPQAPQADIPTLPGDLEEGQAL